jgi:hypothetical protein
VLPSNYFIFAVTNTFFLFNLRNMYLFYVFYSPIFIPITDTVMSKDKNISPILVPSFGASRIDSRNTSIGHSSVKLIYNSFKQNNLPNAIAFDLDETIGSFSDFHSLWSRLEPEMQTQEIFNDTMDLYPEFLRVGIVPVLSFIQTKQESGRCLPIYIYTNNQCEDVTWIDRLIYYLELRVGGTKPNKLFAKPICAFKIRDRFIEPGRTTHEKTYSDFVRCSMLKTENLCFIDDTYYDKMKRRNVYYIKPPPYIHTLTHKQVVNRFLTSDIYRRLYPDNPVETPLKPNFDILNYEKERSITNKILYYIREFFFIYSKRNNTKKRKKLGTCKMSRKRHHVL